MRLRQTFAVLAAVASVLLVQSASNSQAATGDFICHGSKGGPAKSLHNPEDGPVYQSKSLRRP